MTDPAPAAGRYAADQLVVALSHLPAVLAELESWGVAVGESDRDDRLGLALLAGDFAAASGHVQQNWPALLADLPAAVTEDRGALGLELALRGLRRSFKDRWNWQPTVGKNRVLADISGQWDVGLGSDASGQWDVGLGGDATQQWDVGLGGDARAGWDVGLGGQPRPVDGVAAGFGPRQGEAGAGTTVAIVDTGVLPHPWLAGSYRCDPTAVLDTEPTPDLALHHGTFVAGLVLRQAPAAQLWIDRRLDATGHRESWDIAVALARIAARGADIVNLSLGCQTDDDEVPLILQRAVDCLGPSTLVVAAAGNYHLRRGQRLRPMWPAALESVVAVGSMDTAGRNSAFSPAAPWIDARAVGEQVTSTFGVPPGPQPAFTRWNGTSFAAPTVSGYIAASMAPGETATQTWRRLTGEGATAVRFGR